MLNLLRIFVNLCLLRAKPQDLPAAPALTAAALVAYIAVGLGLSLPDLGFGRALLWAVLDTLVIVLLTHGALLLRHFPERLQQTLTALLGSGALLGLVAWPIIGTQNSIVQLVLLLWNLAVVAHILRHALSVPLGLSIIVSFGYFLVELTVGMVLAPTQS
ncbi:MAG: hypothetical protein Q7U07_01000 [Gammaproteobacteria bacterium]|nr:hypothetical protein [Gammaproteobacteria bacterium]